MTSRQEHRLSGQITMYAGIVLISVGSNRLGLFATISGFALWAMAWWPDRPWKPTRCAECDCKAGGSDCNWIKSATD